LTQELFPNLRPLILVCLNEFVTTPTPIQLIRLQLNRVRTAKKLYTTN